MIEDNTEDDLAERLLQNDPKVTTLQLSASDLPQLPYILNALDHNTTVDSFVIPTFLADGYIFPPESLERLATSVRRLAKSITFVLHLGGRLHCKVLAKFLEGGQGRLLHLKVDRAVSIFDYADVQVLADTLTCHCSNLVTMQLLNLRVRTHDDRYILDPLFTQVLPKLNSTLRDFQISAAPSHRTLHCQYVDPESLRVIGTMEMLASVSLLGVALTEEHLRIILDCLPATVGSLTLDVTSTDKKTASRHISNFLESNHSLKELVVPRVPFNTDVLSILKCRNTTIERLELDFSETDTISLATLQFWLQWNGEGWRQKLSLDFPLALWAQILQHANKKPSCLYYLLQQEAHQAML